MNLNRRIFFVLLAFLYSTPSFAEFSSAPKSTAGAHVSPLPPEPPMQNPHPPTTPEEQRRVQFAISAVKISLMQNFAELTIIPYQTSIQYKDLNCLSDPACFGKDAEFVRELKRLLDAQGEVIEIRHAHVIPWSYQNYLEKKNTCQNSSLLNDIIIEATVAPHQPSVVNKPTIMAQSPALKCDEYMVHMYVRFKKNQGWHHLDVIMSEDVQGNPELRRFFSIPIPEYGSPPPGVVC